MIPQRGSLLIAYPHATTIPSPSSPAACGGRGGQAERYCFLLLLKEIAYGVFRVVADNHFRKIYLTDNQ